MSRKGNPWDNAACESFMKTLAHSTANERPPANSLLS
jgi:transposase InsO family protein